MNGELIMDLLKTDHREVEDLFRKAEQASSEAQQETIFQKIANALEIHSQGEEIIVYPRLEKVKAIRDYAEHSYKEHDEIREGISEVDALDPSDKNWKSKLNSLKETVEHHVKEEENEVFPLMEKHFSKNELMDMAEEFREAKAKYKKAS